VLLIAFLKAPSLSTIEAVVVTSGVVSGGVVWGGVVWGGAFLGAHPANNEVAKNNVTIIVKIKVLFFIANPPNVFEYIINNK
jgi:hypothetical protein